MSGPYTCSRCLIGTPNDNDMCDDCQEETMREADPMTTITIPPEALEAADEITALRAEVERLRAALEEITEMPVYGFSITDTTDPHGGDVFCEGTNRFVRERDFRAARKIARAALEDSR